MESVGKQALSSVVGKPGAYRPAGYRPVESNALLQDDLPMESRDCRHQEDEEARYVA